MLLCLKLYSDSCHLETPCQSFTEVKCMRRINMRSDMEVLTQCLKRWHWLDLHSSPGESSPWRQSRYWTCMALDNTQAFPSSCSPTLFVVSFMGNKSKRCHSTKSIKPNEGHMGTSIHTLNVNNNLLLTTGIKWEQSDGTKSSMYRLWYCLQVYIASELKIQRISSHLPLETHCLVDGEIAPHR